MSEHYTLEAFRAIVRATPEHQTPVLYLVKVDGGYLLEHVSGARLKTFRGSLRVFSSSDTVVNFVTENLSRPLLRSIELRLVVAAGLF